MTCAPTDRLLQTITIEAPGATPDLISLQLFNVMDEFFRRTQTWKYQNEIQLTQDITEYDLALPVNAAMVRVLGVSHNGVPVTSTSAAGVVQTALGRLNPDLTFPDGDSMYAPQVMDLRGDGTFTYAIYRPEYITTSFTPDAEQVKYPLLVWLILSLNKSCLECDCDDWAVEEWMWDMFFDNWLDGTLGRLMGMINKPWSNPVMASYHGKRFRNAMAFRKQEAMRNYVFGIPGWRFPRGVWT